MRIGIMTWHQYNNYGTVLQLYALFGILSYFGTEPYIINYHTRRTGENGTRESLIKTIKRKVEFIFYKPINDKLRNIKFLEFLQKNIRFTDKCDTLPELERLNEWMDVFVCGSDQIWAPSSFDPHFFLDFVIDESKTIAYAPSVGLPVISNIYVKEAIANLARRIRYLSTRELSGSKIISEITGRTVETVLDPTLLLPRKRWEELCLKTENESPYLLSYMLGHNEKQWKIIYKIAKKKKITVKIIPVFEKDLKRTGCINAAIGPEDFLTLIKGASFVCTDSFHGMLFAIQFQKNFCIFERFRRNSKISQNSRIYNILNLLSLEDRLYTDGQDISSMINNQINYNFINTVLEEKRAESKQFLIAALDDIRHHDTDSQKNNIKKDLTMCCGCGVCAATCPVGAIQITMDVEGFYTSSVNDCKCISCGKCRLVCPYITLQQGTLCKHGSLFAYKDYNKEVLLKSSSGGAAFALSLLALQEGYQVVGSEFNIKDRTTEHIIVAHSEALHRIQGSKYMQSNFSKVIANIEKVSNLFIFGTPCQIAAARNFCKGDNVVLVDLICHGIPSYYLYSAYQDYLHRIHDLSTDHMSVIFRYKLKGWREIYIYSTDFDKSVCISQKKDPYFLCFEYGICHSLNCFECPWRNKSMADIRLGDYWGERFEKDKTGVSMVMTFTERGREWIEKLEKSRLGYLESTPVSDYTCFQQIYNNSSPLFRKLIIDKLKEGVPLEVIVDQFVMPLYKDDMRRKQINSIRKAVVKKVINKND